MSAPQQLVFAGALVVGDPFISNVVYLCHCDGTNGSTSFTNVAVGLGRGNSIANVGTAAVSTTAPLFGSGCLLPGSSGNIKSTSVADYAIGSGDFTLELAVKTATPSQTAVLMDFRNAAPSTIYPEIYITGGAFKYFTSNADQITGGTVATSTWQRIAVVKISGTTKMYIDGTQVGSSYTDSNTYLQGPITIGQAINAAAPLNPGFIDEIRVTSGVGRYTANYTVASAAFPDT